MLDFFRMAKTGNFDWVSREKINILLSELGEGEGDSALLAGKNYCNSYSYEIADVSPRRVRLLIIPTMEGQNGRVISFIRSSLKGNREKTDLLDFGNGLYASFKGEQVYVTDGKVIAKAKVPNTEAGGIGEIEEIYKKVENVNSLDSCVLELAEAYSSVFGKSAPAHSYSKAEYAEGSPFDQLLTRGLISSTKTYWLRADKEGICLLEANAKVLDYSTSNQVAGRAPRQTTKISPARGASGNSTGYDGEGLWESL